MLKIQVLMSTYNGEKYIKEQIQSILNQKLNNTTISILVRDDGSNDKTKLILDEYQNQGILKWYTGENLKPAFSFFNLIMNAEEADFYAFCDQDDVWYKEKMYYAIEKLNCIKNKPALYCSNFQLVDENLNVLSGPNHISTTLFRESLVASSATGCTVVFNNQLLLKLREYSPKLLVMHDDWAHKVCLAIGGEVIYDDRKTLAYRQHSNNADGGNPSVLDKLRKICKRIRFKECIRSRQVAELLKGYEHEMSDVNKQQAYLVANYKASLANRCKLLFSRNIITPYKKFNIGFKVAILLGYF